MATILVVDDEPDIRSLLTDLLAPEGHIVHTTANGSDALHMVQSKTFDLALVDIWLPGMSGIELLEHLKDLAPDMPVVIITCRPAYETAVQALQAGACDYVEKPFALDSLRTTMHEALERRCPSAQIQIGSLLIDLTAQRVYCERQLIELTATEFGVLTYLAKRPGQVVTYDELLDQLERPTTGGSVSRSLLRYVHPPLLPRAAGPKRWLLRSVVPGQSECGPA
jgi:DNA-binding response OmpR family regulator